MTNADFQAKVLEHMGSTDAELKNVNGWMGKIDTKVDKLQTSGCAKGAYNEKRIEKIENEPKKLKIHGAVAGGGIGAVVVTIAEVVRAFLTHAPTDI